MDLFVCANSIKFVFINQSTALYFGIRRVSKKETGFILAQFFEINIICYFSKFSSCFFTFFGSLVKMYMS